MWEQYSAQIMTAIAVFLAQTVLIGWPIYERRRRQLAEVRSRDSMSELAQMNRMATAGELSASIAHEINQPLVGMVTGANTALRWLSKEKPEVGEAQGALQNIVTAGHRAGDIVTNIRAMFRKDTEERVSTDVNKLIITVLALVYMDLRKHSIENQIVLSEQLPSVIGNTSIRHWE